MPDKKLTDNLSNNSPILSNSLTDAEIKKALELCQLEDSEICETCPLGKFYPYCDDVLAPATVDLINRLQAENERLNSLLNCYEETSGCKQAKAEAYKEFAEKLKSRIITTYQYFDEQKYPRATVSDIDDLLKELVGENIAD